MTSTLASVSNAVPLPGDRFHTDPHARYAEMRREHGPVVPAEPLPVRFTPVPTVTTRSPEGVS